MRNFALDQHYFLLHSSMTSIQNKIHHQSRINSMKNVEETIKYFYLTLGALIELLVKVLTLSEAASKAVRILHICDSVAARRA